MIGSKRRDLHIGTLRAYSTRSPSKKREDLGVEEGAVHAQLDRSPVAEAGPKVREQHAEEAGGMVAVVDIARTVPEADDLAQLRQAGREGVVGGILRVMGIEPSRGPVHPG
jgi:hypothetical protein